MYSDVLFCLASSSKPKDTQFIMSKVATSTHVEKLEPENI